MSVDVKIGLSGLIQAQFQLKASYADISNANFGVMLIIDCTGLEKSLRSVQESIEEAVKKLREKIQGAQERLTQAQHHVNELYSQINTLNNRISDCRYAIKSAKWWRRAFVAMARGIEIAAYEVAKVGVYAAIGVANAALEMAKQIVGLGGIIGEGVLQAVNGVITAALNFFFVKYIRLEAKAAAGSGFRAEIEFVALGKTFHLEKSYGGAAFLENPVESLDGSISGDLKPELDNIENGSFKSNRRRYKKAQYTMAECRKMIGGGMEQLRLGTRLLKGMSDVYHYTALATRGLSPNWLLGTEILHLYIGGRIGCFTIRRKARKTA